MADRRHLLTQPPKAKSDQTLLSLIAAAKMSEQERRLRDEIARGGQSLNMRFHDPLAGVTNQDPLEMATGIPTGGAQDFVQGGATGLMGASEYMTPAYLRPGYQGPQTGLGPVGDALAGLGQVFQGGSAAGPMGGPSTLLAQYAGRLPDAGSAMGTMGGTKMPRGIKTASFKETLPDGSTRWVPGTLRANPPTGPRFDPEMTPADVERYIERYGVAPEPRHKGVNSASYKDTYPDGTTKWVPGTLRVKGPPKK